MNEYRYKQAFETDSAALGSMGSGSDDLSRRGKTNNRNLDIFKTTLISWIFQGTW
jgi:hypothetical protein